MRKVFTIITFYFLLSGVAQSQVYFEEEETDSLTFKDRLYFGGNFSLNLGFGNAGTFIDVSPLVGYMVNEDFSVGLGVNYIYFSREFFFFGSNDTFKVSGSTYGGRAFARHNIIENFFAHAGIESMNVDVPSNFQTGESQREWVPGFMIGGGTFQPVFGRGGINVTILYNLLYDDLRSPYGSEWVIRGGFTF